MKTKLQIFMLVFLCITQVQGQWIEWPVASGGNGHHYMVINTSAISWHQAAQAARDQGGHLVTITSAAENAFVVNLVAGNGGAILGGYQPAGSTEPSGGWTWVTGEPWTYSNWAGNQPDNGDTGGEDGLTFLGNGFWNDKNINSPQFFQYIVERSEPSICTPRKATATATLINGFVIGATITDGGCGYTNPPVVLIQGGGGSDARARAFVTNGQVTAIQIVDAGFGYTSTPRIVIGSPPFVPSVNISVSKVNVTQNVVLGWKYVLETSTNAVDWTPTGQPFVADSESIVTEFEVDTVARLFRLRVVP